MPHKPGHGAETALEEEGLADGAVWLVFIFFFGGIVMLERDEVGFG